MRWGGKERNEEQRSGEESREELYPWFEGDELQDHLDGEHSGEDHVEDVHGRAKHVRLLIVLRGTRSRGESGKQGWNTHHHHPKLNIKNNNRI